MEMMRTYGKCDWTISTIFLKTGAAAAGPAQYFKKPPCFKITKNSKMVTTGHEALCSCSCSPPQLALLLPWYPSCSRAPQCFQATAVLSSKMLFPLPCLGFPTHTRALFPNVLLYVWPLNLSLCLLAPEQSNHVSTSYPVHSSPTLKQCYPTPKLQYPSVPKANGCFLVLFMHIHLLIIHSFLY